MTREKVTFPHILINVVISIIMIVLATIFNIEEHSWATGVIAGIALAMVTRAVVEALWNRVQ